MKCDGCNKGKLSDENDQNCTICYKTSENKVIDDFIKYSHINYRNEIGKLEFVPYDQFKNVEFIAEGGFSKIYKATWIDGPVVSQKNKKITRESNYTVALKKLNNSKNVSTKELNELKVVYDLTLKWKVHSNLTVYFGITQDPITKDIIVIMPYYGSGDFINYLTNNFYDINWNIKVDVLNSIMAGLEELHYSNITHRDFHGGNIFLSGPNDVVISDLGINKSSIESTDDNEIYGIIPYIAPEIFQGQKRSRASDIYCLGMIMWELMTGRRAFWDRNHDAELINDICDGLRPPIVTNAPDGYIELMKACWNPDPKKRPLSIEAYFKIYGMYEYDKIYPEIIVTSDIGPVTTNNPGAIYKSRPLSSIVQSAISLRSTKSQSISHKRKFENSLIINNNENGQRRKSPRNEEYVAKEIDNNSLLFT